MMHWKGLYCQHGVIYKHNAYGSIININCSTYYHLTTILVTLNLVQNFQRGLFIWSVMLYMIGSCGADSPSLTSYRSSNFMAQSFALLSKWLGLYLLYDVEEAWQLLEPTLPGEMADFTSYVERAWMGNSADCSPVRHLVLDRWLTQRSINIWTSPQIVDQRLCRQQLW